MSKKNTVLLVIGFLFFASGNPVLQKAGSTLLGIASPVSNIEEIKIATEDNKRQLARLDEKITSIVNRLDIAETKRTAITHQ